MSFRRSGDGFLRCGDGHVRWGVFGAAGAVFVIDLDSQPKVMLQMRSAWAHEGGTWSCAGGALDEGETAYDGALREAAEEIGEVPVGHRVLGECVFAPAADWSYTTLVVAVDGPFGRSMNFETDAIDWVSIAEVAGRPLHAGFAAAWPAIVEIIGAAVPSGNG